MTEKPSYEDIMRRLEALEREREMRLRAEEESEKRQNYLEAVLQQVPDAVVTLDPRHMVVEWNEAAERIFGYRREEAVGRDLDELITSGGLSGEARDYTRRVLEGETLESVETVRYAKEGIPIQVLVSGSPIFRQQELQGIVALYTDITERKRKERELSENASKYRTIFETTGTATMILEEDATVSMVNAEFEQLSGYSKQEIEGKMIFTTFIAHSEDAEKMLGYHRQRRESVYSAPRKYEVDVLTRNGAVKSTLVTVDLIRETRQSVVSLLDVTHYKQLQTSYKQERDYLDRILESSPDGIAIVNEHGEFVRWNTRMTEIFGSRLEEIKGRRAFEFYADRDVMESMLQKLRSQGSVHDYEIDFLRRDGKRVPCSVSISLLLDEQGRKTGSVSLIRDLGQWKQMMQELQEREEKFKGIASSALDAVLMMDDQGRISFWNKAAEDIFGYSYQEAIGQDLHQLLAPQRYLETFRQRFPAFQRKGTGEMIGHSYELRALHKNGSEFPVEVSLSALKLQGAWHSVGIVRDISSRVLMEKRLRELASTDQLTGAQNRHNFLDCLNHEMKRSQRSNSPFSVFMLDIDHFKEINDTLGHNTGDAILKELVRIIRNNLRDVDILARWGGEEFLVLTPDTDNQGATVVAERLRQIVQEHDFPGAGRVTISLGVAQYREGDNVDNLISRADQRMYLAKENGRNQVR